MKKKINWLQEMKKDRLDSVWYGGEMVEVEIGDYLFKIIAAGDVSVKLNGEMFKDKNEAGLTSGFLTENGILNDTDLQKAIEDGKLTFWDNNWFELIGWDTKRKQYMFDWYDTVDLDCDDSFDWLDDIVKEYEEEL